MKVANIEQLLITLVSKQDELLNKVVVLTNGLSDLNGSTDSNLDMNQKFLNLPIPKLRLDMNVRGWFEIYQNAMRFVDESVLRNKKTLQHFVGYYLSDEVAALYSKIQCDDYWDLEDELARKIFRKNLDEECKKMEIEREKAKQLSTSYM